MPEPLVLDVRLEGFPEPIGSLVRRDRGDMAFAYSDAHLVDPRACTLSLSLPLRDEPFGDVETRAFFSNLLQERDGALAAIMAREGLARDDVCGLLFHLGKDCAGAVSVLPAGASPAKSPGRIPEDYRALSEAELSALVAALADRAPLPADRADPSPLAGVQSKVALTLLPDGRFAEPLSGSGAPTTHILKVPARRARREAGLEEMCLGLGHAIGARIAVAKSETIGGIPVLIVERFDRTVDEHGRITRLHQEDFAQALGLPPDLKYERRGRPGRRFDVEAIRRVLDATADPQESRRAFMIATLFDLLVGNVDGHAKNHALLHRPGRAPVLAPRYDLLPTRLDPTLTEDFAFRIGAAERLSDLTRADVESFLAAMGLARPPARARFVRSEVAALGEALSASLPLLTRHGMKDFGDLIAANVRAVFALLDLPVPRHAAESDLSLSRGGGWSGS